MKVLGRLLMLALLIALAAAPIHAQDAEECPFPEGWQLSSAELEKKLQAHKEWLQESDDPTDHHRAVLCNADLREANLQGGNLQSADLEVGPLQDAKLALARLQGANLDRADLQGADLGGADLQGADLGGADLQGADLGGADLQDAILFGANLQDAALVEANLQDASLFGANLQDASVFGANLQGASLVGANLQDAYLFNTDLFQANLTGANLSVAELLGTNLDRARLTNAKLFEAQYEPATAPAAGYLTGLLGLTTLRFDPGRGSGLVLLRARLAEAGLRDLEREATYALERQTTRHKLQAWREQPWSSLRFGLEGAFRWLAFELSVAYGLYPGRALLILLGFILVFSVPYMVALVNPLTRDAGIWRVWAEDRVVRLQEQDKPERLEVDWYWDPWWRTLYRLPLRALQFSILSAFHIGFRELNVGNWLTRLQPREYVLKATGWVRVVAGLQSLLSVYLLALWVLTYFGRPFG